MIELPGIVYVSILVLSAISFVVAIFNLRFLSSLSTFVGNPEPLRPQPIVSILVPARNEEGNIKQCLQSLVDQNYEALEILVLDDRSTDKTAKIIKDVSSSSAKIKFLEGTPLPKGWVGKNWACHQLSKQATGELILFIDADTILSQGSVLAAVTAHQKKDVDLLTIIPHRTASCLTERLMFPLMDWALFCWIPMKLAHKIQTPHLSATFGQFMLFNSASYRKIGGHEKIFDNPLDDFALGRLIMKRGLTWALIGGSTDISVLPYKGNVAAFKAVSRSVFPALYYRISTLLILSFVILLLGVVPPLTLAISAVVYPENNDFFLILASSTAFVTATWFIVCRKFKHRVLMVPFYPISMSLMVLAAFHSLFTHGLGTTTWKDRRVSRAKIRL